MTKRSCFAWIATFGLMLVGQSQAQADWLLDYDGHSIVGSMGVNPAAADAHFSFAVYQNNGTSGNWVNDLLGEMFTGVVDLAATSVDTDAPYVYFYQVVNTDHFAGGAEHSLDSALVKAVGANVTSVGYLDSTIFQSGLGDNDAGNKVKTPNTYPGGNPGLGEQDFIADMPGDGIFSEHEGTSVGLVSDANARSFAGATIEADDVEWTYISQLSPGAYSSVFYYTSDIAPSVTTGMIFGSQAIGDVVSTTSAVPAPPAMALALLGVPFMGVVRRKKKVAA